MVMADYFSRYPEVIKFRPTTSSGVIDAVKAVFSRHGIPETMRCDNGTQFSSTIHLDNASSLLDTLDLLSELPHIGVTVLHLADRFLLQTSMIVIHSASSSKSMSALVMGIGARDSVCCAQEFTRYMLNHDIKVCEPQPK